MRPGNGLARRGGEDRRRDQLHVAIGIGGSEQIVGAGDLCIVALFVCGFEATSDGAPDRTGAHIARNGPRTRRPVGGLGDRPGDRLVVEHARAIDMCGKHDPQGAFTRAGQIAGLGAGPGAVVERYRRCRRATVRAGGARVDHLRRRAIAFWCAAGELARDMPAQRGAACGQRQRSRNGEGEKNGGALHLDAPCRKRSSCSAGR